MKNKTRIDELAICGGRPAFSEKLFVGRPNFGNRAKFLERVDDLLDRRWFTNNGPYVQEFETRIADLIGVKHCIVMCNATIALEIAIKALGLTGEVIVPSFTFIATAHALWWQNIKPVFCDIDPHDHNIDPEQIEALITPRTTGIIGVHLWGNACDIARLSDIAQRRRLKLLFDAAHAFCCSYQGRMIGNFGDAEVFSFHATKFFNTFEGGAVATNNDELAAKIRLMKNFGFAGYDDVAYLGTNGKMSEISAAMGLTSLESLTDFIEVNRRNHEQYQEHLVGIPGIRLFSFNREERNNYQYVVLEIDQNEAGLSRDQLLNILWAENIIARRYFYPGCHRMEPYRSQYSQQELSLPVTEAVSTRILSLPNGTAVNARSIDLICSVLNTSIASSKTLKGVLEERDIKI